MSDNDNVEYVALQPINYYGVRAYNPGDRVPAANVKRHGYKVGDEVARADSKEAQALTSPQLVEGGAGQEQAGQMVQAQEEATAGTVPVAPDATKRSTVRAKS